MVGQWNSDGGTVWWNSGTVMVEQCWWNSVVEQWNSDGGRVWWKIVVEQCDGTVEQCCETVLWMVEQCWWKSKTVIVEQCGGTEQQ